MIDLDLLKYKENIRGKNDGVQAQLFDPIRKSWFVATPEEFVRQLLIQYLNIEKKFPLSLMAVERGLVVHGLKKRFDLLIYNQESLPMVLIECKAPNIGLNQKTFDQISIYNIDLKVPYLIISNGRSTLACKLNLALRNFDFLESIPNFDTINSKEKNTFNPLPE